MEFDKYDILDAATEVAANAFSKSHADLIKNLVRELRVEPATFIIKPVVELSSGTFLLYRVAYKTPTTEMNTIAEPHRKLAVYHAGVGLLNLVPKNGALRSIDLSQKDSILIARYKTCSGRQTIDLTSEQELRARLTYRNG